MYQTFMLAIVTRLVWVTWEINNLYFSLKVEVACRLFINIFESYNMCIFHVCVMSPSRLGDIIVNMLVVRL